jgi:hypothetical protein
MNLVGFDEQLKTFISGDIIYENLYGSDFSPDWDGSDLEDSKPFTTNTPLTFTWYSPNSSFSPGRLDFIFYTGSVMNLKNSYTLFTETLPEDSLNSYNLQREDTESASDHLPLVADFKLDGVTKVKEKSSETPEDFGLKQNYPNPFNPETTIEYAIPKNKQQVNTTLKVYNLLGEIITTLVNEYQQSGNYEVKFNADNLSSGVYIYRLQAGNFTMSRKMTLLE